MDTLLHDLRYALRTLRRSPGFALAALLTLALGIAANTAIFSVLDAVVLEPLPFPVEHELVVVHEHPVDRPETVFEISHPNFRRLAESNRTFTGMAAVSSSLSREAWGREDEAAPVRRSLVSHEFFTVLGVEPLLGRAFRPEDDRIGAERVVVIGHDVWQSRLGGDPAAVGRRVALGSADYTVVGIMPAGFEYPHGAEVWTPVVPAVDSIAQDATIGFLGVVGRLRTGVSLAQAGDDLDRVLAQVIGPTRAPEFASAATIVPLRDELLGNARPVLLVLLAAAGLLLLIACVNVANLLIARGAARRRELALRAALGASRARVARQLLAEGLVLAAGGAALGGWLAAVAAQGLVALSPAELYRAADIGVDARVLGFTALLALGSAVLFGLLPALRGARTDPHAALQEAVARSTAGAGGRRLARGLVVAEIALSLVLLVGAGLLLQTFRRLGAVELGFDRERTLTVELHLPDGRYSSQAETRRFFEAAAERIAALPGVAAAAGVLLRPLEGPIGYDYPFSIEGRDPAEQASYPFLNYEAVTPGYFDAVGLPLLRGRGILTSDREDAPGVVVISRAVADRFFPGTDPVGRRIKWGPPSSPAPWLTIVGVVGDARYRGLRDVTLDVYVPHRQAPWQLRHLVVRAAGDPAALIASVRAELRALDPAVRAMDAATLEQLVGQELRRPRFHTLLVGLFALLALALAAVGIYGVMAQSTAQRTRELGIRIALGAAPRDVLGLVLRDAARMTALALAIGLAGALLATRGITALLFGVEPTDPATISAVALVLAGVALLAAYLPARRATRVDPVVALRQE